MGFLTYEFTDRTARRAVMYSWFMIPLAIVAFVATRYLLTGAAVRVISQVIFVGAAAAAAVCVAVGSSRAPVGSRGRAVWRLLASTLGLLAASEAVYSAVLLTGGPGGMVNSEVADVLNGAAALCFIAMLAFAASVDRLGWLTGSRIVIDLVAVGTLFFSLLFRGLIASVVPQGASPEVLEAVRFAVYATLGFVVLAGVGMLFGTLSTRRLRAWDRLLGLGIGVYGIGVVVWPAWSLSTQGGQVPGWVEAVVVVLYLVGYLLMALAGLQRALALDVPWRDWAAAPAPPVWMGLVVASSVFGSVVLLGWWTIGAPRGTPEEGVYLSLLSVAATSLVLRTLVTTVESGRLQARALTDEITGLGNVHALNRHVSEMVAKSRRRNTSFIVAVVDLDGFAAVNALHGRSHGDQMLRAVAEALSAGARADASVYRLSGDEFAVVKEVAAAQALICARELAEAVATIRADAPLSASVGVACCPAGACSAQDLVRRAVDACTWVKRHGGSSVAVFDERLESALAVESRMRRPVDNSGVDMARALAAAADVRDPANYQHSRNVAALAVLLAEELDFDSEHIERIQVAAMLHDIGKLALPDQMLGGKLVAVRQRRVEQEHSAMGQRLLEALRMDGVPLWVRSHHERWDGLGFPDGLKGEEAPIEARIIALADAYDGMTAGKRYGAPMSKGAALQEIDLGIGARFDPVLAEKFIEVVGSTSALGWADGWPAA